MKKYINEKGLQKEAISLIWNLSCDLDVRALVNSLDAKTIVMLIREHHYKNVEIQELADITLRNLSLEKGNAMDPLIEKCIIANACTFSVTGEKTFLLQSWHDCYTCNLRSGYGICSICVVTCHKGHNISPPKFSRFFCDCGHGALKGKKCNAVKSLQELGLTMRREKDEDYREKDEDPTPDPFFFPGPITPKKKQNYR